MIQVMLAFAIPTNQTKQAKTWLLARVPLIRQGDQDEFTSESWHATSFYFRDPAGHIAGLNPIATLSQRCLRL